MCGARITAIPGTSTRTRTASSTKIPHDSMLHFRSSIAGFDGITGKSVGKEKCYPDTLQGNQKAQAMLNKAYGVRLYCKAVLAAHVAKHRQRTRKRYGQANTRI